MYACSCFGITEQQVREHAEAGACTPRQIASETKAGTDCGSCVRRIQGLLGRGECPRRRLMDKGVSPLAPSAQDPSLDDGAALSETASGPAALPEEPAARQDVAEAA